MGKDRSKITIKIQNVVSSIDLYTAINLEQTAIGLPPTVQVSYIPDQFPGLVLKLRRPKVSILVFSSGKCVITGARNIKQIDEAVNVLRNLLIDIGMSIDENPSVTIQNVVASGNLHDSINLELAALTLETSMYEPEVFPGLIYRMQDPKVVILLFQSGKFVCTGGKREEVIHEAMEKARSILEDAGALGW